MITNRRPDASRATFALLTALVVAVAGCTGAAANGATASTEAASAAAASPAAASLAATQAPPTATAVATAAATQAPAASAAALDGPTAVPTSIDPCQLFSAQDASQLTGATFGKGVETTTSGNGRICTYGAQTLNVFNVEVAVAPSAAVAQADKAQAQTAAQNGRLKGLKVTELSNLADGAAMLQGSVPVNGTTVQGIGIYVLKGTVFFTLNDIAVGGSAPSPAAMQAAAQAVLGRLP